MRNLATQVTMRKDGVLPRGDWFTIVNATDTEPATIYIYDEIGFWGTEASDFVEQLVKLDADKINLRLNSPGGEVFDGLAIYNSLKQHKAEVTVFVDGLAASAASFIAQAGDKIVMARNATMMIHDGIAMAYGNEQDMLDTADLLGKVSDNIADIYSQRAGETVDYWRGLMRNELWMTGKEAVDFGLADEVLDEENEEAKKAQNKWDLSFYNHAGREHAESPTRVAARALVLNQQKESAVPDEPSTEEPTPAGTSEPAADEVVTPAPADPTTPETPASPAPADPAPADPAPAEDPAGEGAPTNKVGSLQGVMINGQLVTDYATIQNHMESLNRAQEEAETVFRNDFVTQLAADNKIPATQIESLQAHAQGLTAEQFASWSASYKDVPASALFGSIPTGQESPTTPGQPGTPTKMTAEQKADRVSVLQGIVAMHERTMPEDKVKQTKSYIELQQLLGNES